MDVIVEIRYLMIYSDDGERCVIQEDLGLVLALALSH